MVSRLDLIKKLYKWNYYIAIFLLTFRYVTASSSLGWNGLSCFTYIACLLLIFNVIFTVHSIKYYVLLFICVFMAFALYRNTKTLSAFVFTLRIFAGMYIEEKKALKIITIAALISLIIIFSCSLIGIIPIYDKGVLVLGCGNPNMLALWITLISVIYLSYKNINKIQALIFLALGGAILYFTESRAYSSLLILLVLLKDILQKIKHKKILSFTALNTVFGIAATLLICTINYDKRSMYQINKLLSGRMYQGNFYYEKYKITIWGEYISELASSGWHNLLDQGYLALLIQNGLIFGSLFIISLYFAAYKKIKENDLSAVILLLYVSAALLTENVFVNATLNPVCIYISSFLMTKHEKRKREKYKYDT